MKGLAKLLDRLEALVDLDLSRLGDGIGDGRADGFQVTVHPVRARQHERREAGVVPGQRVEQGHAKRVDVAVRASLALAMLFWRRVAGCSKRLGIRGFALLEGAGDAEVDQLDPVAGGEDDVAGGEVAIDHRWRLRVQIVEHIA